MKNFKFSIFSIAVVLSITFGCSRITEPLPSNPPTTGNIVPIKDLSRARQSYSLDWENIEVMPTPPYISEQVRAPWKSGANPLFDESIKFDYKSIDGWVLVYNTFNTSVNEDKLYFVLYNKYKGLLRMYLYIPQSTQYITSNNIVHALGVVGSSSPMMNFSDQDVVNVGTNSLTASKIERFQVQPGAWYVMEHELAYDQTVPSRNYSNFSFTWNVTSTQLSQMKISGTNIGTLAGSIKQSGTNLTASPNININNNGQFTVKSGQEADNLLSVLGSAVVDGIKEAITNGVSGLAEKLLGGIFGSGESSNVRLNVDTRIELTGTIQSSFAIQNPSLAVPGYSQDPQGGLTPAYNQPLGVFYLSSRPQIGVTVESDGTRTGSVYKYNISQPLNYIFNPAVTSIASIQEISRSIVAVPNSGSGNESINGKNYLVGGFITSNSQIAHIIGVRVLLKVTPNDGTSPKFIVKTFAADINYQ